MPSPIERRHLLAAAELLDDLDAQSQRERLMFEDGYRAGYEAGHRVGQAHAEEDMRLAWAELARRVRGLASTPTYDELARRRAAAGPREAEYQGGPVEWEGAPRLGRRRAHERVRTGAPPSRRRGGHVRGAVPG
ncbi:hypothetical protein [Streptosporangium sp. NPDC002524]|uniref:hypothetical protein n=1 Tax=Streptosporangium sp. NPDC002524 TaxID=3154537 RepID=UPI00331A167D